MTDECQRTGTSPLTDPWKAALDQLHQWDPQWAETSSKVSANPWVSGVLPLKLVELISIGLNGANQNSAATRHHLRSALAAGATRDEILLVFKCVSVMSIHSAVVGATLLNQEAFVGDLDKAAEERERRLKNPGSTPACDQLRAGGQWDDAWSPVLELAPNWFDEFMARGRDLYNSTVLSAKEVELLLIALNAAGRRQYEPGIRRHLKAALRQQATVTEIVEVLKLCVIHEARASLLNVPVLAEELAGVSGERLASA
ncbi:MAG: carboxymuconolactone decarboxylase family protein [Verrucomicrobia bacterium]|nr:carboxymuconolactone decarboxylase family protein [Verrucomicrobiota bacterium]